MYEDWDDKRQSYKHRHRHKRTHHEKDKNDDEKVHSSASKHYIIVSIMVGMFVSFIAGMMFALRYSKNDNSELKTMQTEFMNELKQLLLQPSG